MVAERRVERAVGRLHGRHEDQHAARRSRATSSRNSVQRADVVLDVLEHVDADDGVEALLHAARRGRIPRDGRSRSEILRVAVERGARARRRSSGSARCRRGARRSRPGRQAGGADAAADLEHAATRCAAAADSKTCAWYRFASLIVSRSSAAYRFWVWVNLWSTFMSECGSLDTVPICYRPSATVMSSLPDRCRRRARSAAVPQQIASRRRRLRPDRGGRCSADQGRR